MYQAFKKLTLAAAVWGSVLSAQAEAQTYCPASGSVYSMEWIKEVRVNGVASSSGGNGYKLFTAPAFNLNSGLNSLTVTPGYSGYAYREYWTVFIDFNRDGNFASTEKVFTGNAASALTGSMNVPSGIPSGPARMRVMMNYSSSLLSGCGSFYYGEVEDYTVNLNVAGSPPPPPPPAPTTALTAMNIGFDKVQPVDMVLIGKHRKNGVFYNYYRIFPANSGNFANVTLEADIGTQIEWSAALYTSQTPTGDFIPYLCPLISGFKCLHNVGSAGQSAMFKSAAPPPPPPPPVVVDQLVTFENLFAGAGSTPGPSTVIDGIVATTTWPYFYNYPGFPFTSNVFRFGDLGLQFPAPVKSITFQASGMCTNCAQTVIVTADGQPAGSFTLTYNVLSQITLTFPVPVTNISFTQNWAMDNLQIDYQ